MYVILFVTLIVFFYLYSFKLLDRVKLPISIKGAIGGTVLILPYVLFILVPSDFRPGSDFGSRKDWAILYLLVFGLGGLVFGLIASLLKRNK